MFVASLKRDAKTVITFILFICFLWNETP